MDNSSRIHQSFLEFVFAKFFKYATERQQSRRCRKHWRGKGTGEPLKNNFTCSSLSIQIHLITSHNSILLSTSLKNLT